MVGFCFKFSIFSDALFTIFPSKPVTDFVSLPFVNTIVNAPTTSVEAPIMINVLTLCFLFWLGVVTTSIASSKFSVIFDGTRPNGCFCLSLFELFSLVFSIYALSTP